MTQVRCRFDIEGRLQGVGFRPVIFRLAKAHRLAGWVCNTSQGVRLELQGASHEVEQIPERLRRELPEAALIRSFTQREVPCRPETEFQILESDPSTSSVAARPAEVLPDLALCAACARELNDPKQRRFRYPFISCTDCGPRYSILEKLPFDRANTTLAEFDMCRACLAEYEDPEDRRFHSQSNCCPECGPSLRLKDVAGNVIAKEDSALREAACRIREGAIVAVMGVGGFHLLCDARPQVGNPSVDSVVSVVSGILRLRQAKRRSAKPFAVIAQNIAKIRSFCEVSSFEEALLRSPRAPIVLLKKRADADTHVSEQVAPGLSNLGIMLPYSPLHQLLIDELGFPVIATSGNLADEPICQDEMDAFSRLSELADFFLVHDRRIAARVDDSVVRVISGSEVVFRAGRGYAPQVLELSEGHADACPPILAMGGQSKIAPALARKGQVVLMPHFGTLNSVQAVDEYDLSLERHILLQGLVEPRVACDLHPGYLSTHLGRERDPATLPIQHHEAHLLSCVVEHGIRGPVFGVAWDGTGFGSDGTIWGGEFFLGSRDGFSRVGHLRSFSLPGGEASIREPRRAAFGLLREMENRNDAQQAQVALGTEVERAVWNTSLERGLNAPRTSSAGRLFDAVAALLGLMGQSRQCDYEGQAAIELEDAAAKWMDQSQGLDLNAYPVLTLAGSPWVLDWEGWVRGLIRDQAQGMEPGHLAAKFHRTLANSIVGMAKQAGIRQVVLSGGCFQNRLLSEWTITGLRREGFEPYWNQKVPPNDGGLSVGQILGACNVLIHSR